MTVAISLSQEISPSEKKIRVSNTPDGFAMLPHTLLRKVMKLSGSQSGIFLYVWERTVSFGNFTEEFPRQDIMDATDNTERTVQISCKWLKENGWLTIQEQPGKENVYGIPPELLEAHGCLVDPPPAKSDPGSRTRGGSRSKILDLKEKNPITPPVDRESNGPSRKAEAKGKGTLEIPDHPVAEKLKYCGVYPRTIIKLFDRYDPKVMWEVVKQFEIDMQQAHNVNNMAATLVWRIRNGVTAWKSEKSVANSGELSAENWKDDLEPDILEEYQILINKEFDDPDGEKGYVLGLVAEFKSRCKISLTQALEVFDVRGASRDDLFEWNREVV